MGLSLLLLLLSGYNALAQKQMRFGVDGGVSLPLADYGQILKPGFALDVNARYGFNPYFSAGINFGLYNYGSKTDSLRSSRQYILMLSPEFTLAGDFPLKPFVGFDIGMVKINPGAFPITGAGVYLGASPYAGVLVKIATRTDISLKVRYLWINTPQLSLNGNALNIGLGLSTTIQAKPKGPKAPKAKKK